MEADARSGVHLWCLQVKYSLFMQCVNVLFPSRRWGNLEPGEGRRREYSTQTFHKYRLRWQLVPVLCFLPETINGALEQRKVSQVEIVMAMMGGFLGSWEKFNSQLAPKIWFEVLFLFATNWAHFSKATEKKCLRDWWESQHLFQRLLDVL